MITTDHVLLQLAPRAWAAQILDSVRDGHHVPRHVVDLALQLGGDLSPLSENEKWPSDHPTQRVTLLRDPRATLSPHGFRAPALKRSAPTHDQPSPAGDTGRRFTTGL
jgi:hypothetical protein